MSKMRNIPKIVGARMIKVIFIAAIICCSISAHASIDYELRESRKCSSIFYYFEKKYKLPINSLHSISLHETAKKHSHHNILVVWPWTVMDNKEGKSYHFKNQNEAIRYAREQFKLGNNNLDVGCMQINLKHHPEAFSSLNQAFSPNLNVAYGAYFLSENMKKLGSIEKAIGRYHSATEHLAAKYRSHVSKINREMPIYKDNLKRFADGGGAAAVNQRPTYSGPMYNNKNRSKIKVNVGRIQNSDWFRQKTR